jgi:dTDP-4-dehydrorhamnose 3,5-epimerase
MPFEFARAEIPDIIVIQPRLFRDDRGFFMESYKRSDFAAHGIAETFVQSNHSRSPRGIVRGLHYQKHPKAQGKLVRTLLGEVFDVAVDLQRFSTYGRWTSFSAENGKRFMFHGFCMAFDQRSAEVVHDDRRIFAVLRVSSGTPRFGDSMAGRSLNSSDRHWPRFVTRQ